MNPRYSKKTDRLYLQMYPMLFEYARSSLSSDALAEEAVQDSFMMTGSIFRMFPTRELLASTTKHMSASGPEKMVAAILATCWQHL